MGSPALWSVPVALWPAGKYNATMIAEWFEGEFHVICRYKWTGAMGDYSGLEVLGYNADAGGYYGYSKR